MADPAYAERLERVLKYYAHSYPTVFTKADLAFFVEQCIDEPPADALYPLWSMKRRTHNWRNYASEALEKIWETLTPKQRIVIAAALQEQAAQERWD